MSGAKLIEKWQGITKSHAFSAELYLDEEQAIYIANIEAQMPALAQALRKPGQAPARMSFEEPEKLKDLDIDVLKARVKKLLKDKYGEILQIREQTI